MQKGRLTSHFDVYPSFVGLIRHRRRVGIDRSIADCGRGLRHDRVFMHDRSITRSDADCILRACDMQYMYSSTVQAIT